MSDSQIECDMLSRFGIIMPEEEITRRFAATRTREMFELLLKNQNKPYDIDKVIKEKDDRICVVKDIRPIEGAVELIKSLHSKKIPLAVASSSNVKFIDKVLGSLKIKKYFNKIVSGDHVSNGKPDPEIFLLAAKQLGVEPKDCVVIEDAINGMEAAKRAGMKCVGLVESKSEVYPTKYLVISLKEVDLKYILSL